MKRILIFLIKGYQKIVSHYFVRSCRYAPTCSQYAVEALEERGVLRGVAATLWRILRCNPLSSGGYDPVKQAKKDNA